MFDYAVAEDADIESYFAFLFLLFFFITVFLTAIVFVFENGKLDVLHVFRRYVPYWPAQIVVIEIPFDYIRVAHEEPTVVLSFGSSLLVNNFLQFSSSVHERIILTSLVEVAAVV